MQVAARTVSLAVLILRSRSLSASNLSPCPLQVSEPCDPYPQRRTVRPVFMSVNFVSGEMHNSWTRFAP